MVCSNCGHPVGPEDQYCRGCGAYLTDAPVEESAPVEDETWEVPYATGPPPEDRRRGLSAGVIAAAVAGVVLIALLLVWALGGDDETTTTATGTPTDQATSAPATSEPGTATPTPTPTDSPTTPTESPTDAPTPEAIDLPDTAEQCGTAGAFTVYSGNDATSCPFAENVGAAYADLGETTEAATLSGVSSPVTGESYDLTCDYTSPVRCTGGNNAVVYLVPAG